jgi:hypothetical protein
VGSSTLSQDFKSVRDLVSAPGPMVVPLSFFLSRITNMPLKLFFLFFSPTNVRFLFIHKTESFLLYFSLVSSFDPP